MMNYKFHVIIGLTKQMRMDYTKYLTLEAVNNYNILSYFI